MRRGAGDILRRGDPSESLGLANMAFRPAALLLTLAFPAGLLSAQLHSTLGPRPTPEPQFTDETCLVSGTVKDLSRDATGHILYCTAEGEVGRITLPGGAKTVLATAASGPFPNELRAVA